MAQNSTIFKVFLQIADMDRHYYADHNLTLARHPSETDERMMMRLLGFVINADERLEFTRGLCVEDEPDLWKKSYSDEIELWVDVGLPSEKQIKRAASRAQQAQIIAYGSDQAFDPWWKGVKAVVTKQSNVQLLRVSTEQSEALADLAQRGTQLSVNIQDGQLWFSSESGEVTIELEKVFPAQ